MWPSRRGTAPSPPPSARLVFVTAPVPPGTICDYVPSGTITLRREHHPGTLLSHSSCDHARLLLPYAPAPPPPLHTQPPLTAGCWHWW